ncbi:MAG: DnaD domain protein [Defluviitaleaceae bacterium]|nr:DnaD domain protein [Defluviitaleaceae bacterium]
MEIQLSAKFIDEYMNECPPIYALVYIYGLRKASENAEKMPTAEFADHFRITDTDVINAWKYWQRKGLIIADISDKETPTIKFLPLNNLNNAKTAETIKTAEIPENQPKISNVIQLHIEPETAKTEPPTYTPEELTYLVENNPNIKQLHDHAQQTFPQNITYIEMAIIYKFYDWYRLPIDVIIYLLTFCAEHDKTDLRYIEKIAQDWSENNIISVNAAQEHVLLFEHNYMSIMKAFGKRKAPAKLQKKFIDTWLIDWQMPLNLVLEAWDRAALETAEKLNFRYVNGIIGKWYKAGIKSLEDLANMDNNWSKLDDTQKAEKISRPNKRPKKYIEFDTHQIDYDEITRHQLEVDRQMFVGG